MEHCHAALETSCADDEIDAKACGHSAGGKLMTIRSRYPAGPRWKKACGCFLPEKTQVCGGTLIPHETCI